MVRSGLGGIPQLKNIALYVCMQVGFVVPTIHLIDQFDEELCASMCVDALMR